MKHLSLRVERHVSNALKIVDYLIKASAGRSCSSSITAEQNLAMNYIRNIFQMAAVPSSHSKLRVMPRQHRISLTTCHIFSLLANVADVKSLGYSSGFYNTFSQCTEEELLDQGIKPNTIRLSIGIEKVEDLIAALDAAFEAIK